MMNPMGVGSKRYSADLKRDAVAMVVELVGQVSTEWTAITKAADLLEVLSAETVRQWVRKTPTAISAAATDTSEEIRRLHKEVA
jgi:transposase